jgi:hypothetical protein
MFGKFLELQHMSKKLPKIYPIRNLFIDKNFTNLLG